jgi:Putative prokaryotic signal transducing protein
VQVDPEDFKRHYALLTDDALLEIDPDELVGGARPYYDAELAERKLIPPDSEENAAQAQAETESQTGAELQLVATFLSVEEANFARGLLQSADISCSFQNDQAAAWTGIGELRLMVPASAYDRACEILEYEISEEDLIAQAEAEASEDDDLA